MEEIRYKIVIAVCQDSDVASRRCSSITTITIKPMLQKLPVHEVHIYTLQSTHLLHTTKLTVCKLQRKKTLTNSFWGYIGLH